MLYTGGILSGANVVDAFANCDSSLSLVLGSFFTLVFIFIFYLARRVLRFNEFCETFGIGVKAMIPAIMILSLAWTLSGICSADYLNIGGYVKEVVSGSALVGALMPAIMFAVASGLAFSTGTSWGTFGILIPIAFAVVGEHECADDFHGLDSGRSGVRRSHFPDFRHDNPGLSRGSVRSYQPCFHADSVCALCGFLLLCGISGGGHYRQRMGWDRRRSGAPCGGFVCN